ncbi:hypothetical protein VM98_33705, partial [Streptomyces rubellomurinus subsp. indigoferus]
RDASPATAAGTAPSRWLVFSDLPYMAICGLYASMAMAECVPTVALPLWISQHTQAPPWLIGPFGMTNVLTVGMLRTRAERLSDTPRKAGRSMAGGGALNGEFLLLVMLASGRSVDGAVVPRAVGVGAGVAEELCVM